MADPKGTITDRIMAAAEEADVKVKAPKSTAAAEKPAEEVDPKARVEKLFAAVSSELAAAGMDTEKLRELQAALQSRAGMLSRAVEAAVEDSIAKAQAEAAEKAAAEPHSAPAAAPPPAKPATAEAHPAASKR